ncbi:unnamed protein product [Brassica oleracea]
MALNNQRRAPRHLALGLADPQIIVPETSYAEAQQNNRRSLIGRVLSPRRVDLHGLLDRLPLDWHADRSRLRGRIIGGGKFQFLFETELDLEMVLWSGPYTYEGWLVVLQRWEDEPGPDFLKSIPMWVKIRGILVRYLSEGTVREIVKGMGEVMEVELDDKTFDVRFVRVRVDVSVETRLCFKKVVRFESGEVKVVSVSYEDIACNTARFRFCRNCGDLKHLKKSCTRVWVDVPDPNECALSPPPPDASFDGTAENNGERGTSSGTLEGELEPAGEDGEYQQTQGLDGVDGGDGKQVQSEMVGTSAEGSKRKFEAVEDDNGLLEKRIRGSSNETEPLGEE